MSSEPSPGCRSPFHPFRLRISAPNSVLRKPLAIPVILPPAIVRMTAASLRNVSAPKPVPTDIRKTSADPACLPLRLKPQSAKPATNAAIVMTSAPAVIQPTKASAISPPRIKPNAAPLAIRLSPIPVPPDN